MSKKILAVLEQREGKIKKSSFEVVSTAAKLASELSYEVEAIIIGDEIDNLNQITLYGISNIFHYKNEALKNYSASAYRDIIVNHAQANNIEVLLFSNTAFGKDLAPLAAVKLNAGCLIDLISIDASAGEIIGTRPIYAGKALLDVKLKTAVKVITLRPNVFKAVEIGNKLEPNLKTINVEQIDLTSKAIQFKKSEGKLDVAEADIIVSGGRGMKGPENFHLLEELSEALGAAVGASRAVVDAGWRSHGEQVGQTGKTVSPSLYIACGISGAIQHLAGMSSSKYIVAINKDKDAPIFSIADYGIAGDVFEILPALTEEIKKIKS
jgi:electron transfer flavoprotein alpha subunit